MAVTDYLSIRTEINLHTMRGYSQDQIDTFLGLLQPKINRRLTAFQRDDLGNVIPLVAGVGTLPSDFTSPLAVSYSTYGTLKPVSVASLTELNPSGAGGVPAYFAITGTQIKVTPIITGDVSLDYVAGVPALSALNTTNWLLEKHPDAYFSGVMAESKLFEEDFEQAGVWEGRTNQILSEVNMHGIAAQYRRAGLVPRGATP